MYVTLPKNVSLLIKVEKMHAAHDASGFQSRSIEAQVPGFRPSPSVQLLISLIAVSVSHEYEGLQCSSSGLVWFLMESSFRKDRTTEPGKYSTLLKLHYETKHVSKIRALTGEFSEFRPAERRSTVKVWITERSHILLSPIYKFSLLFQFVRYF